MALSVSIGRTGEMDYGRGETPLEVGSGGIVKVSRTAEELFRPETIASFEGKPFTIKHPRDFVDTTNWKELAKGIMQNVRRGKGDQSEDLVADLLITDSEAIKLVESGMRQLSCGYEAEYVQTGEGTGIQKNIIGNHLALVEEGRAGDAYKINDHKGDTSMNKKLEAALQKIFGKTSDEIMKEAEEKEKKEKAKDSQSYDELVALCKDLMAKVEKIGQPTDEKADKEEKAKDADKAEEKEEMKDEEVAPSLEDRLAKIEAIVSKLVERESKEEVQVDDEEQEEELFSDKEMEAEDEDKDAPKLTGDEKSKVEILAPGYEVTDKAFKAEALKVAYKTADGKKAIDALTGGKPTFDSAEQVSILFNAVPEMLKSTRKDILSKTKTKDFASVVYGKEEGVMTAEKMNELNQKFYNKK